MASVASEIIDFGATLDFQLRDRYELRLDAKEEELDLIFGKYTRPTPKSEWIPCGLNGCDQPHRYGFVIRLHDGRETHCGPHCGESHFNAKWTEVIATAKAAEDAAAFRKSITNLLIERDALTVRGGSAAEQSGTLELRVAEATRHLYSVHSLRRAIENCARNGGSIRAEIEVGAGKLARSASRPKAAQLKTVAIFDGATLLTTSFVRYSSIIASALPSLRSLDASDLAGANKKELAQRSAEGQNFRATLERAERQIELGRRLFERDNLEKLELLVTHHVRKDEITPHLRKALTSVYALSNPA